MKIFFLFLFFIFVHCAHTPKNVFSTHGLSKPLPIKTKILFVLYDAGETNALISVFKILDEKKVDYKVLLSGTSRSIMKECENCVDIQKDCHTQSYVDQATWQRETPLSDEDLKKVEECIKPTLVVAGAVSNLEFQIAQLFEKKKVPSIIYRDDLANLDFTQAKTAFFQHQPQELWVASHSIANQIRKSYSRVKVKVVGQPVLEDWMLSLKNADLNSIRTSLKGFNSVQSTVLFAGQYGENYAEVFEMFLKAASKNLNLQYLISPHPKTNGEIEKKISEKYPQVKLIFVPKNIGTKNAAFVSDIVVAKSSTVLLQALFCNKKTYYLDLPTSTYKNFAIENKWIKQFFTHEELSKELKAFKTNSKKIMDFYNASGIPNHSAEVISNALIEKLNYK
jgi:hypothetical protein